jgi:agmatinase
MPQLLDPIPIGRPSFINAPRLDDLETLDADVAIIGVAGGVPYDMEGSKFPASGALQTIREQSMRFSRFLTHYDYDLGGDVFAGRDVKVVDCGDVTMIPGEFEGNVQRTTDVIRQILDRGALPVALGGSHEISIPVFRAYEGRDSMYLVQLDAHLDWRDEINGVRDGLSSVMRRASEMGWISGMAQIGLRGVGSARQLEVDDARAYGKALLIGAQEVHRDGVEAVLAQIPDADHYYITLDADGLDPTIAPAVGALAFGGLTYSQATGLLRGIAKRGRVVGFDFPVVRPHLDIQNRTSLLAARLTLFMIGALAHEGQIGS